MLRKNTANAERIVRGLSGEQLDRHGAFMTGDPEAGTVANWIEWVLIDHIDGHFEAIRKAVESDGTEAFNMSSRATELAERFHHVAGAFERAIAGLSDDDWVQIVPEEQRTVVALVNHVALAWRAESADFHRMAHGKSSAGLTSEGLDETNATHGVQYAEADRDETMAKLQSARQSTAVFIRGLSDEQLSRRGKHMPGESERSVAEWIEVCLIGHPAEHLPGVLAAVREKK